MNDFSNFLEIQTKTAWGRTLAEFASFCNPSIHLNPRPEHAHPGKAVRTGVEGRGLHHTPVALDVGCGPGLLPAIFSQQGYQSFGVDLEFGLLSSRIVPTLIQADAFELPFPPATFDLVTATNLLFLFDKPLQALREWKRVLVPGGQICLLNPSENLSVSAATGLADERGLQGTARESLLNWAKNAETHFRWTEKETEQLLSRAGLRMGEAVLKVGPGFARFIRTRFD